MTHSLYYLVVGATLELQGPDSAILFGQGGSTARLSASCESPKAVVSRFSNLTALGQGQDVKAWLRGIPYCLNVDMEVPCVTKMDDYPPYFYCEYTGHRWSTVKGPFSAQVEVEQYGDKSIHGASLICPSLDSAEITRMVHTDLSMKVTMKVKHYVPKTSESTFKDDAIELPYTGVHLGNQFEAVGTMLVSPSPPPVPSTPPLPPPLSPVPDLPDQCTNYQALSSSRGSCDNTLATAWYRPDSGAHGGKIPTSAPATNTCGTSAVGWQNYASPSVKGSTTSGTMCFHWSGDGCMWNSQGQTTHCGDYFVYHLEKSPACSLRYCH